MESKNEEITKLQDFTLDERNLSLGLMHTPVKRFNQKTDKLPFTENYEKSVIVYDEKNPKTPLVLTGIELGKRNQIYDYGTDVRRKELEGVTKIESFPNVVSFKLKVYHAGGFYDREGGIGSQSEYTRDITLHIFKKDNKVSHKLE